MKITTLDRLQEIVKKHKNDGAKIGLITGCFDIIHIGHIELFRFAKKHCDIVIVGLENDETIKLSKGKNRPIHNLKQRAEALSELRSINYIFNIDDVIDFSSRGANKYYIAMYKKLKPDYLITNSDADSFWEEKKKDAESIGVKLLRDKRQRVSASTKIIEQLSKEL